MIGPYTSSFPVLASVLSASPFAGDRGRAPTSKIENHSCLLSMDPCNCARSTRAPDTAVIDFQLHDGQDTEVTEIDQLSVVGSMMAGVTGVCGISEQATAIDQKESEADHTEDEASEMSSLTEQTRPTEPKGQVRSQSKTCDETGFNQANSTSIEIVVEQKTHIHKDESHQAYFNEVDEEGGGGDGGGGDADDVDEGWRADYEHAHRATYEGCFYFRSSDFCEQDAAMHCRSPTRLIAFCCGSFPVRGQCSGTRSVPLHRCARKLAKRISHTCTHVFSLHPTHALCSTDPVSVKAMPARCGRTIMTPRSVTLHGGRVS